MEDKEYSVVVEYNEDCASYDLYDERTGDFLAEIDALDIRRSDIERICKEAFEAGRASR